MINPFVGAGLWVFNFGGEGTPLVLTDAQAYAAAGVQWVAVKVSDGTTGGGKVVVDQIAVVTEAGMRAIPWAFMYGTLPVAAQFTTLMEAAGGGAGGKGLDGASGIGDIEAAFPNSVAGFGGLGDFSVCTWGNPLATSLLDVGHPGAPSIGQLADEGVTAFMPQAYAASWGVSEAEAIAICMASYKACNLSNMPPILPVGNTADMLAFAQAAKAQGCQGVSAWRHGAPMTPSAMAGVAALFPPTAPPPPTPPPAAPLTIKLSQDTPAGDYTLS